MRRLARQKRDAGERSISDLWLLPNFAHVFEDVNSIVNSSSLSAGLAQAVWPVSIGA